MHVCPACAHLALVPCMNVVITSVLTDDGERRSTADVQLVGCISDSDLSVLFHCSINLFIVVCHL